MDFEAYYSTLSRRTRLSIAALTVLAHITALLLLLSYLEYNPLAYKELSNVIPSDELAKTLEYDSTILSQSPYDQGATVLFADDDPQEPALQKNIQQPSPSATELEEETVEEVPPTPQPEALTSPSESETPPVTMPDISSMLQEPQTAIQEEQKVEVSPQEAAAQPTQTREFQESSEQRPRKRRRRKRSSQTPAITMAQLAKGFLKSMEQERGASTVPEHDMQKLAQHIYATKVWKHFKSVINAERLRPHNHTMLSLYSIVTVTIAHDGTLTDFRFGHSRDTSGASHDAYELEELFKKALKRSGLFPPIPKQFQTESVTLHASIDIHLQPGQTIVLTINNRY